jgi:hypothetical protein
MRLCYVAMQQLTAVPALGVDLMSAKTSEMGLLAARWSSGGEALLDDSSYFFAFFGMYKSVIVPA